jgi:ABC-type multidrug transport system fused ATPase/permease subunit/GT2 family glycosyltransferase
VEGKFFYAGRHKLYLRGVTYGTFRPGADGSEYGTPDRVEMDFAAMASNGINAVRLYTVPPPWLLDHASQHGLYVMIGLPWEQHVAFLDSRKGRADIERRVVEGVRACAGHPAVLCYAIGNEIPASIVRWYGRQRVEAFLKRLYRAAKAADPTALVTYVNFPTTEYLDLSFLDFVAFNVYLETPDQLRAYLARLQNLAGDRPLVMAEIGLDSRRNGLEQQAAALSRQIGTLFAEGCAGGFVFSWTDEWYRGGNEVEDWDFGLVDRERRPKPAQAVVREAFGQVPFPCDDSRTEWPRISVVVCSHNGARTLRDCCEGMLQLEYPNFEVIVVDDGSTDGTPLIAREYGFRVISTPNQGLSSARNTGLAAATGEILAYTDDDARPDPHWLQYLASTFMSGEYAAVGGPNLLPLRSGVVSCAVENSPGGPVHVLLNDREAEHIPGCNMAIRKAALEAIGGFDPTYRTAGDDVDVCWRLQACGWKVGFHPAAVVWHHRRSTVKGYWRQQVGYGRAEALLERKWPEKYNAAGHVTWAGQLYGGLAPLLGWQHSRVYQGVWGSAPFQRLYARGTNTLLALPLMPEWYPAIGLLAILVVLSMFWPPLVLAVPLFLAAVAAPLVLAGLAAIKASVPRNTHGKQPLGRYARMRAVTFLLHLLQPLARLVGRVGYGLTPWRNPGSVKVGLPIPRVRELSVWRESWQSPEAWLEWIEADIKERGGTVQRGGDYDNWDLKAQGSLTGSARLLMAIEEHGNGQQLARFRIWPRVGRLGFWPLLLLALLCAGAALSGAWVAFAGLVTLYVLLAARVLYDCASGVETLRVAVRSSPGTHLDKAGKARRPHPYRMLLSYARPYWRAWLFIIILTALSTAFTLLEPWPMKVLVDNVLGGQALQGPAGDLAARLPGATDREGLLWWVVAAGLLVFLGASALDALLTLKWVRAGQGMVYSLARTLFARIQRRSLVFHSRVPVGDSLSRVTGDAWVVNMAADRLLLAPAQAGITTVIVVAIMLPMNLLLTMLAVAVTPFMVISSLLLSRRIKALSRARRQTESRISVVQAFTREDHEQRRFKEYARKNIHVQQQSALMSSLYNLGSGLPAAAGAALVLWVGAGQVMGGSLTVGELLVFVSYLGVLQAQLKTFAGTNRAMQEATGSAERVSEVLATNDAVRERPGAPELANVRGHIRLVNVSFGYDAKRPVLRDLSLEIEPGHMVAVVGQSGAGKSTLAGLISRLYDPQQGHVEVDGQDVREVSLRSLRDAVAIILQEPFLLSGTIAENIAYSRPDAEPSEVKAAAEEANADSFIERLPEGYDTELGERGATLSGGERQRISIARALLKDAPILILDEPTSALDARTEQSMLEHLRRLREGRTTIIITHRLSAARAADRTVVLHRGRLVEQGTHDELMARGGLYSRMYNLQSGSRSTVEALRFGSSESAAR